jgi:6-phosphogluconolactonase (cycloisomerase 2 family)
LQRLGFFSGVAAIRPGGAWSFSVAPKSLHRQERFGNVAAYVGNWPYGIQLFHVKNDSWTLSQTIASDRPSCLALHPSRKYLYAANEIDEYHGLPTGTVEAYSIDGCEGRLTLLNRQPLSLSATAPRYLAVSPDGSSLIVAVHGGGSYNVLPVRVDGSLDGVSGILKETGCGPDLERQDTSHPQMVLFDPTHHRLLSADLGSDNLNIFTLSQGRLNVTHRRATDPGIGPRLIAIHPSGQILFVMNELNLSISCFRYDAARGKILDRLHHQLLDNAGSGKASGATAMAMHPSGNFLVTSYSRSQTSGSVSSRIAAWHIDSTTGKLDLIQELNGWRRPSYVESIVLEENALFILSKSAGIFQAELDSTNSLFDDPIRVAEVSAPKCMFLHHL